SGNDCFSCVMIVDHSHALQTSETTEVVWPPVVLQPIIIINIISCKEPCTCRTVVVAATVSSADDLGRSLLEQITVFTLPSALPLSFIVDVRTSVEGLKPLCTVPTDSGKSTNIHVLSHSYDCPPTLPVPAPEEWTKQTVNPSNLTPRLATGSYVKGEEVHISWHETPLKATHLDGFRDCNVTKINARISSFGLSSLAASQQN
ncbi:hypothetical protein CLF_110666, partial [Clonorchis sinensis]